MSSSSYVARWRTSLLVLDPGAGGLICWVRVVLITVVLVECAMVSLPLFMKDSFSWGTMVGKVFHAFGVFLVVIVGVFFNIFS